MADYTFSSEPNSYFQGQDMRITRESDGRTILVNRKDLFWGLNVKAEYVMRERDPKVQAAAANLPEGIFSGLEEQAKEFFWREAEHLAYHHGLNGTVFSEGRSGGWLCADDTRSFDSESPANPTPEETKAVAGWIDFCFAADDLRITAEAHFDDRILEANQELQVELSQYADWVGAEVRTLDGAIITVAKLEVIQGRAALRSDKRMFSFGGEATLVRKADGQVPSRLTADPIMEQVFHIIEARGDLTKDQIDSWLDADDQNDPVALYEEHVAPAVNAIEDAITAHYAASSQTSTD